MAYIYPFFEEEFMVIQPNEKKEIPSQTLKTIELSELTKVDSFIDNNLIKLDTLDATEYSTLMHNRNSKPIEITKNVDEIEENEDFIRVPYKNPLGFCYFNLMNN